MATCTPETIERIEHAIPLDRPASVLDIWRVSGGFSETCVKSVLVHLHELGRVRRIKESFRSSFRYRYQRVA